MGKLIKIYFVIGAMAQIIQNFCADINLPNVAIVPPLGTLKGRAGSGKQRMRLTNEGAVPKVMVDTS